MLVRKRVAAKSPVRENCTQGSVGGPFSNGLFYPHKKSKVTVEWKDGSVTSFQAEKICVETHKQDGDKAVGLAINAANITEIERTKKIGEK